MLTDRERLVLLNLVPGVGSTRLRQLLEAFGTLEQFWAADAAALVRVEGIGTQTAGRIEAVRCNERALRRELELAARAGVSIVTLEDPDYPAPLKQIADPPLVIYRKGAWKTVDAAAVAIVGSRQASPYGRQMAERLAYDLALRGLTIISGLARGIDAAAHRGALKAGGRTIAVLGSGLDRLYPLEHDELAAQIMAQGAVVSEYPMEMEPLSQNFPRRNRVISGLCRGVVVVEAAARSGALITADCALEQGREVFAVPGKADSWTSQGAHRLLKQGARLVTSVEDVLEELGLDGDMGPGTCGMGTPAVHGSDRSEPAELKEEERAVWAQLCADAPCDVEMIALQSGLSAAACASTLTGLALKRLVKQLPGQRYVRC